MTTAASVSALPDIQIYEGFRISLRNLQRDFRARCCTEQTCEMIDMLTRVTPSTRPEPTPAPGGDLALSRWGGGASRSTRQLLKFLRKLFTVTEKLELPAARRLPISRDGYFKIFRAEIMAHTGLKKDALTRALLRFETLGLISRHRERQENGHQHLWLRFNPDAMFTLLNRLTDFRAMRRATKTLLVAVAVCFSENDKKPEQNQPFLIASPVRDSASVSSRGGGVDPCVGEVGGSAIARAGSSTSPGDQPEPPVDQKIPPGGAGEDCVLAEPAAPPAPPTPTRAPVAFFAGGSAAEAVLAAVMDREVPACTSNPGVKYHQGLEVVGEVNLIPAGSQATPVTFALPEDCQPVFTQLERLSNFMTNSEQVTTDKDIQHLVMWIHHPDPESRMTLADVSDYVSRRQNNHQEAGGFMADRIWSCSFADFTACWPVIIRILRREQAENDLTDNLTALRQIRDLNATADQVVCLSATHGDVRVAQEKNGLHFYMASPECLQQDGRSEITKKHLAVNATKAAAGDKFCAMCMKTTL